MIRPLSTPVISSTALRQFVVDVFKFFDVSEADATCASDVLAYSDEHGIDSHGIARLKTYVDLLDNGRINPRPEVRIIREKGSVATIDGDNGLGLVVGPRSMGIAMRKAREFGSGWVSVCNTNHYGAAGYYPVMALKHDLIGIAMTNSSPGVAPFNGREKMLGTNPIAIAFPALKEPPVVIDFASSAVSYGKVELAAQKGQLMDEGLFISKNGLPAADPREMINGGALLPLGGNEGHKGYCMAAMVDILTAVLSGANWGPYAIPFAINILAPAKQVGKGIGHFFGALDIEGFRNVHDFKVSMDEWILTMRNAVPQPGKKQVLVPGDPERLAYAQRIQRGIPLSAGILQQVQYIEKLTGLRLPL